MFLFLSKTTDDIYPTNIEYPSVSFKYPKEMIIIKNSSKFFKSKIDKNCYFWLGPNDINIDKIDNNINLLESKRTTLIIMAYKNHEGIIELLKLYSSYINLIYEIILIWNNPLISFNISLILDIYNTSLTTTNIIIYPQLQNSLANRWMITKYHKFKTQSAMFIDDDIYATKDRILCLLNLWNNYKNYIISSGGYRSLQPININKDIYEFDYYPYNDKIYNFLLPGWGMTISIKNIWLLSNILINYHLLDIIDGQIGHCDDIAMSLSFSTIFGKNKSYFFGIDNFRLITNTKKREKIQNSTDGGDYKKRKLIRNQCLNLLLNNFKKYGLNYIPIYNHYINKHTISCNKMSKKNINHSLYCPKTACWQK